MPQETKVDDGKDGQINMYKDRTRMEWLLPYFYCWR